MNCLCAVFKYILNKISSKLINIILVFQYATVLIGSDYHYLVNVKKCLYSIHYKISVILICLELHSCVARMSEKAIYLQVLNQ